MSFAPKKPPPGQEDGFSEMSSAGCLETSEIKPPSSFSQVNFQKTGFDADITCASMRAAELRDCLVREISRAMAIGLQAQAALLDGDDDAALANLRRHWIATRTGIAPLACELGALRKEGQ